MQKVYNVGIIGYGGMAGFHFWSLNTFKDKDNIKVYGVYDLDESRIQEAIKRGKDEFNMVEIKDNGKYSLKDFKTDFENGVFINDRIIY